MRPLAWLPLPALALGGLVLACQEPQRQADEKPTQAAEAKPPEYTAAELVRVGKAYNARGDSAKAVPVLEQALAKDPKLAEGHFQLGLALSRLEKLDAAIAALERAHQLDAAHVPAAQLLGMAYDLKRRGADALKVYEATLGHHPHHSELSHEYGLSLLMAGKVAEGLAALERARKAKPGDPGLLGDLGYAYLLADKAAQAQPILQEAVDRDPGKPEVVFHLARACLANKDPRAAAEALKLLVKLVPDEPGPHFHLGVVLHQLGKKAEARASVERALERDKGFAPARKWLADHPKKK